MTDFNSFRVGAAVARGAGRARRRFGHRHQDHRQRWGGRDIRCAMGSSLSVAEDRLFAVVYRKAEDCWVAYDLRGAQGVQGGVGPAGAAGEQGPAGPNNVVTYSGATSGAGTYTVAFVLPTATRQL